MMVRTQISLAAELHTRARARATALDISLAEYLRQLVNRDLAESPRHVDRARIFDLGTAGDSDVASGKARMIAEAIRAAKSPRSGT